jgi:membrane-associated phospholipid phosphatase
MLNKMSLFTWLPKKPYMFSGVKAELRRSHKWFVSNDDKNAMFWLTGLVAILAIVAMSLYFWGGYHAGFFSINYVANLLPADVWQIVTFVGDAGLVLCLFLFVARRSPATIWVVSIATIIGTFLSRSIKVYFGMLRPPAVLAEDQFVLIGKGFEHYSFPSGHSLTIFILVSVLFYFSRSSGTRATLVALGVVVALSRVIVGVHWPIDVLAGGVLGIAIAMASIYLAKRWSWGFTCSAHFVFVGFLLFCAIYLFFYSGGYPQASGFAKIVASSALLAFINDYLLTSYSLIRLRRQRLKRVAYDES